jgi:hypothetical protein
MKTSIFTLGIALFFAACNNTPNPEDSSKNNAVAPDISAGDTAGAGQFQQWKEQQNTVTLEGVTDNTEVEQPAAAQQQTVAAPAPRIIYRDRPASTPRVARVSTAKTYGTPAQGSRDAVSRGDVATPAAGTVDLPTAGNGAGVGAGSGVSNEPVASTAPAEVPEVEKNKGWSKAAKGTAIGAGSGAVLGAIISKKKGKGAVIGGIIGAAGGYVLGKKQDKKDTTN